MRNNMFTRFFLAGSLVLLGTIVNNANAQGTYPIVPPPQSAPDPALKREVERLREEVQQLRGDREGDPKKGGKKDAPAPTTPFFDGSWGGWRLWLGGFALLIAAGIGFFVWWRRRRAGAHHGNNPQPTEPPPPPPPANGGGNAHHVIVLAVLAGTLVLAGRADAANSCIVTEVGGKAITADLPIAVSAIDNFVVCNTGSAPSKVELVDKTSGKPVPVKGLRSTANGFTFTVRPTVAANLEIRADGQVIPFYATDGYTAYSVSVATAILRPEVKSATETATKAQAAVVTLGDKFERMFGADGRGGSVGGQIVDHDRRIAALEARPAPTVDLSAYDRRLDDLDKEIQAVKASADKNAEGIEALGNRRVGKGGIFGRSGRLADLPEVKVKKPAAKKAPAKKEKEKEEEEEKEDEGEV